MINRKTGLSVALIVIFVCAFVPVWADRDGRQDGDRDKIHKHKLQESDQKEKGKRSEDRKYKAQKPVRVEKGQRSKIRQPRIKKSDRLDRGQRSKAHPHKKPRKYKPYKKKKGYVLDKRFRHNHYYPRRGHKIRKLPRGHRTIRHRGKRYHHYHGTWYFYSGLRYVVIRPPIGLSLLFLPPIYTTIWVSGTPYYYANDVYYLWQPEERVYIVSEPPPKDEIDEQSVESEQLFVYPKRGQSEEKQASDRYQCHQWATQQTGFDPTLPGGNVAESNYNSKRADYNRAMKACLEARGYSVQ